MFVALNMAHLKDSYKWGAQGLAIGGARSAFEKIDTPKIEEGCTTDNKGGVIILSRGAILLKSQSPT